MDQKGVKEGMMKFNICTLGCKANQYDSFVIKEMLKTEGFIPSSKGKDSDICIINTCTVTHRTDSQCRQEIRRIIRNNPDAIVIVTGCYAQVSPDDLLMIEGIDFIVPNTHRRSMTELIKKGKQLHPVIVGESSEEESFFSGEIEIFEEKTRAFLKIQDGCNASCTFCIIPKARGKSRSLPADDAVSKIKRLFRNHMEVVLTGIHLGAYGWDLGKGDSLYGLLKRCEVEGINGRIRLSSIEPEELSSDLIHYISRSSFICNHLHIPLQSGDDFILEKMGRPYRSKYFADIVYHLRDLDPSMSIGTDVIVGFPGEGEREFLNTYELIERLPISYIHVFPFSKRKGTKAYSMPDQVDERIVKKRVSMLIELGRMKKNEFYKLHAGKELEVIVEREDGEGLYSGISRNYIPVLIKSSRDIKGKRVIVRGKELVDGFLYSDFIEIL